MTRMTGPDCAVMCNLISTHTLSPASVQAHRTKGVTGSEEQEGANGVGGGNGNGNGVEGGKGDVNGHGDGDGAGAGTGVEVNERAQDGNGGRSGDGAGTGTGWRPVDEHRMGTGTKITGTRTRTRIGSGKAEGRRRSARNRKIVVDTMWKTGETWEKRRKNVEKKGLVQYLPTQIIERVNKEARRGAQVLRAQVRFVQVERVCPLCRV